MTGATRELLLDYADQQADPFSYADTIAAGDRLRLGDMEWLRRSLHRDTT